MPDAPATCLRVALPVPLPRLFDYLPPPGAVAGPGDVGRGVRVVFGSRELAGVVAAVGPPESPADLRQALAFPDPVPLFAGELFQSLSWLARYTHAPLGEVMATALPAPLRAGGPLPDTRAWAWALTAAGAAGLAGLR